MELLQRRRFWLDVNGSISLNDTELNTKMYDAEEPDCDFYLAYNVSECVLSKDYGHRKYFH